MGAFGIFAAILTFVYVIYYAVMVSMDLFGNKAQKIDSVEVISSHGGTVDDEALEEEEPTFIGEDVSLDKEEPAKEEATPAQADESTESMKKEDIDNADDNTLFLQAKQAKENAEDADIHSSADVNAEEFDEIETRLVREQEASNQ